MMLCNEMGIRRMQKTFKKKMNSRLEELAEHLTADDMEKLQAFLEEDEDAVLDDDFFVDEDTSSDEEQSESKMNPSSDSDEDDEDFQYNNDHSDEQDWELFKNIVCRESDDEESGEEIPVKNNPPKPWSNKSTRQWDKQKTFSSTISRLKNKYSQRGTVRKQKEQVQPTQPLVTNQQPSEIEPAIQTNGTVPQQTPKQCVEKPIETPNNFEKPTAEPPSPAKKETSQSTAKKDLPQTSTSSSNNSEFNPAPISFSPDRSGILVSKRTSEEFVQVSRFNCLTCKEKHRKCNRRTPACNECIKRSQTCQYPPNTSFILVSLSALEEAAKKPKKPKEKKEKKDGDDTKKRKKKEKKDENTSPNKRKKKEKKQSEENEKKDVKKRKKKEKKHVEENEKEEPEKKKKKKKKPIEGSDEDDDVIFIKEVTPKRQQSIEDFLPVKKQ